MKVFLTQDVVDNVDLPKKGERWLSDTKIRGFGLRVWLGSNGPVKKAYALRIKDIDGKVRRKTFSPYAAQYEKLKSERWSYHWADDSIENQSRKSLMVEDISLGQVVDAAREWAQDEIDKIKGRKVYGNDGFTTIIRETLKEERIRQEAIVQNRIKTYTLAKAKSVQLNAMQIKGVSQTYIDRLDKVSEQCIPEELKCKKLIEVQTSDLKAALLSITKISSLKMLRSFLGQILTVAERHHVRCSTHSYRLREIATPDPDAIHSIINDPPTLKRLFHYLEDEDVLRQQAYALRLYFLMSAPLSMIMKARWDQLFFYERTHQAGETPKYYGLEWVYGDSWRSKEWIRSLSFEVFVKSKAKVLEQFGESEYCFPSPSRHHLGDPIKSASVLWQRCLEDLNLAYISPKALRDDYRSHRYYGLGRVIGSNDEIIELTDENLAKLSTEWAVLVP